ncbi:MAG: hypothetical protein KIT79_13975 [Deltaproteobacteria bacterium]|nr:hypothetical protein [Deltaproteobacteria bacterium]
MAPNDPLLAARRIRHRTLFIGLAATAISIVAGGGFRLAGSIAAGTALAAGNLWVIEQIVRRYFRSGTKRSGGGMVLAGKLLAMVLILYLIVHYVPVHLLAFMGGFAALVAASLWEGLAQAPQGAAKPEVN